MHHRKDGWTARPQWERHPVGVAELAKKYNKPVIAFAGCIAEDALKCNSRGIDAFFPILRETVTIGKAMEPEYAQKNMGGCGGAGHAAMGGAGRIMKENKYDNEEFFLKYSQMDRSKRGLKGAGEWS